MAKSKAAPRLLDEVVQSVSRSVAGPLPWHLKIAEEHRAEIEEVRAAYRSGKITFPLKTFCRAVSKSLRERGIATIGEQGVQDWLTRDD